MKHNPRCLYLVKAAPMLAIALVAGGSLVCAPQAHAGSWNIKVDTKDVMVGNSWSTGTNKMERSDFTKTSVGTSSVGTNFSVYPYPPTPALSNYGNNATFNRTVAVTITLHYNGSTTDLPPKIVTMQMNGDVSGLYELPPAGYIGGSSSLKGTTGLTDDKPVSSDFTWPGYPPQHQDTLTGKSLVTIPNPKQNQDIVIGPILLNHYGYIGSANKTSASPSGSGSSVSYTSVLLSANISLSGSLTNYGLYISSDLEPSYKKATKWSELPLQKDANGVDIPGTVDASQVSPSTPAFGAGGVQTSGPWGVACKRNLDGSMTVESPAQWDRLQKAWFGGGTYTANLAGYYGPVILWSWSGGTPLGIAASDVANPNHNYLQIRMGSGSKLPSATSGDVNLGGDVGGNGSLISSTASVNVYQSTNSSSGTNTSYTVNWHRNYENVVEDPSTVSGVDPSGKPTGNFTYNAAPGTPTGAFPSWNTNQENSSIEVWVNPDPMNFLVGLSGSDWTVLGVVATVATGGMAALPEASVPTLAVASKAWPAMATCLTVSGMNYHYSTGPSPSNKQQCVNNSASWQQAVSETLQTTKDPRSVAPSGICPMVRVDPPSLMNGFTLTQLNDSNWTTNPLWGKCTMTPWVKSVYQNHLYKGDGYDSHGYVGRVPSSLSSPYGSPQVIACYSVATTPANP